MNISKVGRKTIQIQKTSGRTIMIQTVIRIAFSTFSAGMLAYFASPALMPTDTSLDETKPVNEPTFANTLDEAKALCGGPVVKTGPEKVAAHVVVVLLNGKTVRMDTGEAIARWESRTDADNVWAVAICKKDLL